MRKLILFALMFCGFGIGLAHATTWFVRTNGGPIYHKGLAGDSCNGKADVGMTIGRGANQSCAVNDFRYLYMNGPGNWAWIISGGDTVVIRGCTASSGQQNPDNPHCRVGNDVNINAGHGTTGFCAYAPAGGLPACTNPTIPAGTSGAHTRILGGCAYDSTPGPCNTGNVTNKANLTQLFGGWDVYITLDLRNTQYVDVEGLELTDHNNCMIYGNAGLPSVCVTDGTEDYAQNGIETSNTTSNILLQDVDIHGFPSSGIYGAIGGPITMIRDVISANGFAGWNFDDGTANGIGASINASYVTTQFSGCNEEYPIVDPIPITYCYSQSSGGFGDAWSGQDAYLGSFTFDHSLIRYNIKDGFIGPHTSTGQVVITNSVAIGNGGMDWKYHSGYNGTVLLQNNLTINNCNRMSAPLLGAPSTYSTYFEDSCRAGGDADNSEWPINGSVTIVGNTFIMPSLAGMTFSCSYKQDGFTINSPGAGYTVGQNLLMGGSGAVFQVTTINGTGGITGGTLTTTGQFPTSPYVLYDTIVYGVHNAYIGNGNGSGLEITMTSSGTATCNGGPRVLVDNLFYGVTDTLIPGDSGNQVFMFCYSACNESVGLTNDSMWTTRSNNLMYNLKPGTGQCTYANEQCSSSPLLVNQPPANVVNESDYDIANPANPGNAFLLTSGSPARGAGTAFSGLTTDYYGATRLTPTSEGALEYATNIPTGYTLTTSTSGGAGTVNCGPFSSIAAGYTVICAATPSSDTFTGWSGSLGLTGTYTPTSGVMPSSAASVIAAFSGSSGSPGAAPQWFLGP